MTDDPIQWTRAAEALKTVAGRFAAGLGFDKGDAQKDAASAILERSAAGELRAAPRGFLLNYEGPERPLRHWFDLRHVEPDGRRSDDWATMDPDTGTYLIPASFWRMFKHASAASHADWASGDFYITEFADPSGSWSGAARDVHFDFDALPGAGLTLVDHSDEARSTAQPFELPKNKGGRLPKYDWPRALAHLVAVAQEDGLDPTAKHQEISVSHIAQLMEAWFDTQRVGRPGSQARHYAAMVVNAIRQLRADREQQLRAEKEGNTQ